MKARVIKEWEMYGITHKVGEIMTIPLHSPGGLPMISDRDAFLLDNGFIEEIEEPLIKDEKIRKAIRAWAEANSYGKDDIYEFNDFSTGWKSWSLEHKGNGDDNEIHFNGGIDFDKVEHQGYYTIEELCGELQNDANMSL